MKSKPFFAVLLAFSMAAALFAPAAAHFDHSSYGPSAPASANTLALATHQVNISAAGFEPAEMTIAVGEDVNWTNLTSGTVILEEGLVYTLYLPLVLRYNPAAAASEPPPTSPLVAAGTAILPGASHSRNFPLAGTYHFFLQGNLKQQFLLHVIAPADLEVRSIVLNPNPAAQTASVSLSTDIYNLGTGAAGAFSVSWKIFPMGGTTPLDSGSWNLSGLAAGGQTTLNATFTASLPGPFTVQVTADPLSSLPDTNPANNTREVELGVTGRLDICGNITTNTTWAYATYVITCPSEVSTGATLTIRAGTVVKFGISTNGTLTVNGSLVANGIETSRVTFTSLQDDTAGGDTNADGSITSPLPGDWNSLVVGTGGTVSLTHADIHYGGYYWCGVNCYGYQSPLYVYSGGSATLDYADLAHNFGDGIHAAASATTQLTVTHSTIATSALNGIKMDDIQGSNTTITDNTFTGNGAAAVSMVFTGGSFTALGGNSGSGNAINGIQVAGTLGLDTTLPGNPAFAVVVNTSSQLTVTTGTTLTLSPGTVVKLAVSTNGTLNVNGSLVANGTETSRVTFTSLQDDTVGGDTNNDLSATIPVPGDWNSLVVGASGTASLSYADIRYGGYYWCGVNCYGYQSPLYVYSGGSATLDYLSLAHNNGYGIYAAPSGTSHLSVTHSTIASSGLEGIKVEGIAGKDITITDNTFTGNGAAAVRLVFTGGSVTALAGNSGTGNAINGIQMSGTLGLDTTLPGNPDFAYVVSVLSVDSGRTLTLLPGTLFKLAISTDGTLIINGSLAASGTELSPVTFTSIHDDTIGGDTNNNASGTTPAPGDWNSIYISPGASASLTYANIRYGGYYWCGVSCYGYDAALYLSNGGSATLEHVTFAHNLGVGIYGAPSGTSHLAVANSNIETSELNGIQLDGIAGNDISLTNNTFTGNGGAGVVLGFSGGSLTALAGNSGSGNGVNGIQMHGNLGLDTSLPGNAVFAYVISGSLSVDAAKTLTLSPGAVVKFASTGETLTINGSLVASGTQPSAVVFTSLHDDSYGGDTNEKAGVTSPARGDWNSIVITSGGTLSLTYANIYYGGFYWCGVSCYGNNVALLLQGNASASLNHTIIRDSNGMALSASGNSGTTSLTIEDSTIEDNGANGIDISNAGSYTLTVNRTIIRNNSTGIHLSGGSINAAIHHCNITSNSVLGLNNLTPSLVDATLNWWGADSRSDRQRGQRKRDRFTLAVRPGGAALVGISDHF